MEMKPQRWSLLFMLLLVGAECTPYSDEHHRRTNMLPNRSVIVQLFEWKWLDIADECERFLGPKGYGGVQTSPASENLIIYLADGSRPWYERYQVMSYKLKTRSGNEAEFLNMTTRCNNVGVRIYVDVVINHMTGDAQTNVGTAGSTADSSISYYPAVPYTAQNFNRPECDLNNLDNATEVRVCKLVGLKDLNQTMPYVRQKIIQYLDRLVDLGAAGFRVDAAKHMWPEDLWVIYSSVKNLDLRFGFPPNARPYVYQEVTNGGAVTTTEYKYIGDVTEFTVVAVLYEIYNNMRTLQSLKYFGSPVWRMLPSANAFVFVDNHDTQRNPGSLSFKFGNLYKLATTFLLAHSYGQPRVMSSYDFSSSDQGPPNVNNEITSPIITQKGACTGGWVCEHRWKSTQRMARFRNIVLGTNVQNWWDNGNNQIAFSRGNKGFVAFNIQIRALNQTLQTGLPGGSYCDVISGRKKQGQCTGKYIFVNEGGFAQINLSGVAEDIHLAIHVGKQSRL